jgi:hypothetical protein
MCRKISLTCPHCSHTVTVFHPLCPACRRPYVRESSALARFPRDANPAGVCSQMALAWVFLMVVVAGTSLGMAAWAGAIV